MGTLHRKCLITQQKCLILWQIGGEKEKNVNYMAKKSQVSKAWSENGTVFTPLRAAQC